MKGITLRSCFGKESRISSVLLLEVLLRILISGLVRDADAHLDRIFVVFIEAQHLVVQQIQFVYHFQG